MSPGGAISHHAVEGATVPPTTSAGIQPRPRGEDRPLKIAIASSGLGHVSRGIETWAADLARSLRSVGQDAILFQGAGEAVEAWHQVVPCKKRSDADMERWTRAFRRLGGWRFGCGSGYQLEQTTFALRLWPRIRQRFDILHVQDPVIALILERLHRADLSRPRVILAHGTEEPIASLRKYSFLQHLAPCYLDEWQPHRPAAQAAFAVPNYVDTTRFLPADRLAARRAWGLPPDHFIVLCVAAIKRHHKRIDYLLREFASFQIAFDRPATLVVAGAREAETEEIVALGRSLLESRVRFLVGVSRERMPSLYQAADVFALASLHEMMPIAVLEAMASGLPVACNRTPTLQWMVGPAGDLRDLSGSGGLAHQVRHLANPSVRTALARAARSHAESTFSEEVVLGQLLEMYRRVAR